MPSRIADYHQGVGRRKVLFYIKTFTIIFLIIGILSVIIYSLFFSPVFKIRSFELLGYHNTDKSKLTKYFKYLYGENIFLAKIDITALRNKFPLIKSVNITRNYPSGVKLNIIQYPPFALYQDPLATYVFSSNGVVINKVPNTSSEYYKLPLVTSSDEDINNVPYDTIANFVAKLENDKLNFVTGFNYLPPYELVATYNDGHKVLLTFNKSIDLQIQQIDEISKYMGFSKCRTLDVRFTNIYCATS